MENESGQQAEDRAEDGEGTEEVGTSHKAQAQDALRDTRKGQPSVDGKYKLTVFTECPCGASGNLFDHKAVSMGLSGDTIELECNVCGQRLVLTPEFKIEAKPASGHVQPAGGLIIP